MARFWRCTLTSIFREETQPSGGLWGVLAVHWLNGGAPDAELANLFRREYPRLVRALGALAGVEAAEDAVQDAFVQAARHWSRIGRYDEPAAWVRRVALNRLSNQNRNSRRFDTTITRLPDRQMSEAGEGAGISDLVAMLPRRQRETVCLYYLADQSVADIARLLGVAEGTVKSQLHDARQALRAAMEAAHEV